jgi:hypothetical protein
VLLAVRIEATYFPPGSYQSVPRFLMLPIVGNVSHYGGGGGTHQSVDQPHAPIDPKATALAPGAPVWGQDASWSAVSVPSGELESSL